MPWHCPTLVHLSLPVPPRRSSIKTLRPAVARDLVPLFYAAREQVFWERQVAVADILKMPARGAVQWARTSIGRLRRRRWNAVDHRPPLVFERYHLGRGRRIRITDLQLRRSECRCSAWMTGCGS